MYAEAGASTYITALKNNMTQDNYEKIVSVLDEALSRK
jgi:hypothetical protein